VTSDQNHTTGSSTPKNDAGLHSRGPSGWHPLVQKNLRPCGPNVEVDCSTDRSEDKPHKKYPRPAQPVSSRSQNPERQSCADEPSHESYRPPGPVAIIYTALFDNCLNKTPTTHIHSTPTTHTHTTMNKTPTTHTHTHRSTHAHKCAHTRTHTHTHAHTHTHTHTHHTHTYTHTLRRRSQSVCPKTVI
jgi:hypothetical protein